MRDFLDRYFFILRQGDGGGGGPGAGDPPASPPPGDAQPPAALTFPENLPVHLKGETYEKTIDNLLGAYLPARQALDAVPKAPDKADAYQLTLEGALAGYGDTLANDPIMPDARKIAHECGMSQDQFQKFVGGFINIMHDKGAFAPMPTDAKIAEGLIDASLQGNARGEAITGATKRLTDARAWVDGLKEEQGGTGYSAHERAELAMMVNSPGGVAIIERLQKANGQQTVNPGGTADPVANAQAEYEKRLNDPRNASDPAFAAETREMSKRLFQRR